MGIFDWWWQTEIIKLGLWTHWQSVSCTRLWAEMWSVYARVSPGWPCKGQKWSFNKQNAAFVTYGSHFFPRIPEIQIYTRRILDPLNLIPARACGWLRQRSVSLSFTHTGDFAVDLGGVLALGVRILRGGHLQDAHSEGVDVHRFVVLLLVHLRGHELWRSWKRQELNPASIRYTGGFKITIFFLFFGWILFACLMWTKAWGLTLKPPDHLKYSTQNTSVVKVIWKGGKRQHWADVCIYLHSPMTLLAKEALLRVASPRSPILTEPVGPVMKMLSHFRSLWMMGGVRVCRKWSPLRICRLQRCSSFSFISLNLFKYL